MAEGKKTPEGFRKRSQVVQGKFLRSRMTVNKRGEICRDSLMPEFILNGGRGDA
jgi:hypothetical protein